MKRLLLIACSERKRPNDGSLAMLPAIERYDGPSYRVLRKHREEGHRLPRILILSALYGLIGPKHPIANYDQRMRDEYAAIFKACPHHRNTVNQAVWKADETFIFGGALYKEVFFAWLPRSEKKSPLKPFEPNVQFSNGPIGIQLHQLKVWLETT